jgi:hypothetical protein
MSSPVPGGTSNNNSAAASRREWTGSGVHDLLGFLLYIPGNIIFYSVLAFLAEKGLRRAFRPPLSARNPPPVP